MAEPLTEYNAWRLEAAVRLRSYGYDARAAEHEMKDLEAEARRYGVRVQDLFDGLVNALESGRVEAP